MSGGGRTTMPTYVLLAKFTEQGIRNIKESPKRAEAFRTMCDKVGPGEGHLLDHGTLRYRGHRGGPGRGDHGGDPLLRGVARQRPHRNAAGLQGAGDEPSPGEAGVESYCHLGEKCGRPEGRGPADDPR